MVVAVGGGKTIDVAKSACAVAELPLIVVPTQLTADGIASPVSVIRDSDGALRSGPGRLPIAVAVDLAVVAAAPAARTRAGLGDLLANPCALRDWQLAAAAGGEEVDDFAALLSQSAFDLVYAGATGAGGRRAPGSSCTACCAGSCSAAWRWRSPARRARAPGSEHLISHALDALHPGTAQHGEQVAFGALLATHLQGGDWRGLREFMLAAGLAGRGARVRPDGRSELIAVVRAAPSMRPERHTVLSEPRVDGRVRRDRATSWPRERGVRSGPPAPGEADALAPLLYAVNPELHDRFAGGRERALRLIETAFDGTGNSGSAEVVRVAEVDGRPAGVMGCYPGWEGAERAAAYAVGLRAVRCCAGRRCCAFVYRMQRAIPESPHEALYIDALATAPAVPAPGRRARAARGSRGGGAAPRPDPHLPRDGGRQRRLPARLYESCGFIATAEGRTRARRPALRELRAGAGRYSPMHLDHEPLPAAAVELRVEDLLPRAEVEPALGHRQHDLVVDEQVLEVRVAVVLAAAVVAVVAGVGQQLARRLVGRLASSSAARACRATRARPRGCRARRR